MWAIGLALTWIGLSAMGAAPAAAQDIPSPASQEAAVRDADTGFWRAFNACDAATMATFFTEDVEFYHDITGLTRTRDAVTRSMMTGPCGTPGLHMRRERIEAGVQYNPIPGYGAILAGEHLFYARRGAGPEKPATRASFMTIWRHQAGQWRMTRIVSYSHRSVPYAPSAKAVVLPVETLKTFVGRYRTAGSGDIVVTLEGGALTLQSGSLRVILAASAPDRFFAIERDLSFTFVKTPTSYEVKVEENGAIVASGVRVEAAQ